MLLTLSLLSVLQVAAADSVPGTWAISGDIQGMALNQTCTFKQSGTALTGSCTGEGGAKVDVTGEVAEGKITFRHGGEYEGQALSVIYSGTLASPTEIKGTIQVMPFDVGGVFTAMPAPANP